MVNVFEYLGSISSMSGVFLIIFGLPAGLVSLIHLIILIRNFADFSSSVITTIVSFVFKSLGRLIFLPLCGAILFFQGWRLDPIIQFGQGILVLGVIICVMFSLSFDLYKLRIRRYPNYSISFKKDILNIIIPFFLIVILTLCLCFVYFFFQTWRLDPIFHTANLILSIGIVFEVIGISITNFIKIG